MDPLKGMVFRSLEKTVTNIEDLEKEVVSKSAVRKIANASEVKRKNRRKMQKSSRKANR